MSLSWPEICGFLCYRPFLTYHPRRLIASIRERLQLSRYVNLSLRICFLELLFSLDLPPTGDGVDDTPLEDRSGTVDFATEGRSCVPNTVDTCPGDGLPDDVYNIMTFSWCSALDPAVELGAGGVESFTPGQLALACTNYEIYHVNAEVTDFCHVWYEFTFDSNPEQIGLYVENNGHYYQELRPGTFGASEAGTTWISFEYNDGINTSGTSYYVYSGTGVRKICQMQRALPSPFLSQTCLL